VVERKLAEASRRRPGRVSGEVARANWMPLREATLQLDMLR
jgi:hypothetical protein